MCSSYIVLGFECIQIWSDALKVFLSVTTLFYFYFFAVGREVRMGLFLTQSRKMILKMNVSMLIYVEKSDPSKNTVHTKHWANVRMNISHRIHAKKLVFTHNYSNEL